MADKNDKQLSFELDRQSPKPPPEEKPAGDPGQKLTWVCHPAKKNMRVTILVSLFILVIMVVVYFATYSPFFTILAFVILFGSLASYYFPARYELTEDKIIVKTKMQTQIKTWSQYRTFYPDKNGVLLSPFARPSRLENFRGIYIRFWNNRDEVMAFVRERMEKNQKGSAE